MTEAERQYEKKVGVKPDNETAVAVGLVWAIENANTLADRVKIAKEALKAARASERSDILLQRQSM
jgi:hypothetical protein